MAAPCQTVSLSAWCGSRIQLCKAFLKAPNQRFVGESVEFEALALKRSHLRQGALGVVQQCFIALQVGHMGFHRSMIIWSSAAQCAVLRHTAGSDR